MPQIAEWIDRAVRAAADEPELDRVAAEVADLMAGYPMPGWA
jgi:glycine hydroxymethyltransferase